jgi:hypothetical protein
MAHRLTIEVHLVGRNEIYKGPNRIEKLE